MPYVEYVAQDPGGDALQYSGRVSGPERSVLARQASLFSSFSG